MTGPWTRTEPPSSASRPRPRTKMRLGAFTRTSRRRTEGRAVGAPSTVIGVARASRSSVVWIATVGRTWVTSSRSAELPKVSGTVISVRARLTVPESSGSFSSGPVMRRSPLAVVVKVSPVRVARVVEVDGDVDRQAAGQADRAGGRDGPARGQTRAGAVDVDAVAVEAGEQRHVGEPQVGERVRHRSAGQRDQPVGARVRERAGDSALKRTVPVMPSCRARPAPRWRARAAPCPGRSRQASRHRAGCGRKR